VRHGILKGVRGPRGGYELAREPRRVSADDILRAAGTVEDADDAPLNGSALLSEVVIPALAKAEEAFSIALGRLNIEELTRAAADVRTPAD
jgi:DNA-binding IscR family transcriptional regulator